MQSAPRWWLIGLVFAGLDVACANSAEAVAVTGEGGEYESPDAGTGLAATGGYGGGSGQGAGSGSPLGWGATGALPSTASTGGTLTASGGAPPAGTMSSSGGAPLGSGGAATGGGPLASGGASSGGTVPLPTGGSVATGGTSLAGTGGASTGGSGTASGPAALGCTAAPDPGSYCDQASARPFAFGCPENPGGTCQASTRATDGTWWCCQEVCQVGTPELEAAWCTDPELPRGFECHREPPQLDVPAQCVTPDGKRNAYCCP